MVREVDSKCDGLRNSQSRHRARSVQTASSSILERWKPACKAPGHFGAQTRTGTRDDRQSTDSQPVDFVVRSL